MTTSRCLCFRFLAAFAVNLLLLPDVLADWGDTVDPTFNCPALTTCKQICVPQVIFCPDATLCGSNETLCPDGTCSSFSCEGHNESPCPYECAPIACHKVDNYHETCLELYGEFYANEEGCGAIEMAQAASLHSFTEGADIFFYSWITFVTVALLGWCAYNQRVSPVADSVQPLELGLNNEMHCGQTGWQTGYKVHPIGNIINILTASTLLGIQVLLLFIAIQYYVQQELFQNRNAHFDDEKQILLAFEITWLIGFFWSFALKFPYSIRSLHLRRCVLGEATHVAVCAHEEFGAEGATFDFTYIRRVRWFFAMFYGMVHTFMTFLFSDRSTFGLPRTGNSSFSILPVQADEDGTRFIIFRFRRYNLEGNKFIPGVVRTGSYLEDIIKANNADGLSSAEVEKRRRLVGDNAIPFEKPRYWKCLADELSKPFYTYQNFMVWSWVPLWYYYMAFVWAVIILVSAFSVSYFHYRNQKNLYKITDITGDVEVTRDGKRMIIPHQYLVPGDVMSVGSGVAFCDMVLVSSEGSTLVDESALTGEANPVGKAALDPAAGNEQYSQKRHKRNTILAGTTVLEVDNARAIAMQIASFTARGELIRDINSFERHQFKFDVEVPVVITILFFYAIVAFIITNYFIGDELVYGFFYGIYVVGTTLPPLLPTVFTVSVGISDDRLSRKRVACANSETILVAGKVTRVFFDKTGTLTKQGLDFLSAKSITDWNREDTGESFKSEELNTGMAVCHTLTRVKESGDLVGNPVDCVMFRASETTMLSPERFVDKNGNELAVVKHFDFDHTHMTQSVIVTHSDGALTVYVKGSGEKMKKLCRPETLPPDFDSVVRDCARQGIYQISMGTKSLDSNIDVQHIKRDDVESELSFLGVINFKNTMREDTPSVIQHLAEGSIQSIMVTGDNILTGICIAKESGILGEHDKILVGNLSGDTEIVWRDYESDAQVDPPSSADEVIASGRKLAITGEGYSYLKTSSPKLAADMMDSIRVFGRCTPNDKIAVVSSFVDAGFITMMCGDGGNDCGALKTAHVGVALSDAEASTVAPFTSLDKSITSVLEVLLEGQCALASAFASYKYMIIYGQISTICQMIHAYFHTTYSEWCWVFIDGIWTVTLAFGLPLARAAPKLAPSRPTASILGLQTLSSVLGLLLLNFLFIAASLAYLFGQDWFQCRKWTNSDVSNVLVIGDNYETEVLFIVAGAQYISSAMALNFGYEFRRGWFHNYIFVAIVACFIFMHLYAALNPGRFSCLWRVNCGNENVVGSVTFSSIPIQNDFSTTIMPKSFQRGLVVIVILNALVIACWEYFVVNRIRQRMAAARRERKMKKSLGAVVPDKESFEVV